MFFKTFAALLALAGAVTPYPSSAKRADDDEIKIYAYGSGISGLQVYGGTDGTRPPDKRTGLLTSRDLNADSLRRQGVHC